MNVVAVMKLLAGFVLEVFSLPFLVPAALAGRFVSKRFDIGLGPLPLINNVYHKMALERQGYRVQTFVDSVYFITHAFDVRADIILPGRLNIFRYVYLFLLCVMRYRCIYIYFDGGPLAFGFFGFSTVLWRVEPLLYRMAGVKVVVLPYGGDVQEMTRTRNLLFKHAMSGDYPEHRWRRRSISARIDLWTRRADHIVGGCEWVDYLYHWDTLMLAHFSIDTAVWSPAEQSAPADGAGPGTLRIFHAPNHRNLKGTQYFIRAVDELRLEGYAVELILKEKVPNEEIRKTMASADVVADQLIVGWYAMFALEAMAMGKPVLCYIRGDLERLYIDAGLIEPDELPIVRCSAATVKDAIRGLLDNRPLLGPLGQRSRAFVQRHHSLERVGNVFRAVNCAIGVLPRGRASSGGGGA